MNAILTATRQFPGRRPSLPALLVAWTRRVRSRQQLAELDDRMLADIGLTREQAMAEARRPFWMA